MQLNGRRIGGEFSTSQRGVRSLQVSASFGLQYGVNVLRARVGLARTVTVRFRVRANRPLAGAGLDRRVAAGDEVVLDGRSSRALGGAGLSQLRYRWDVLRVPRSSRVPRGRARAAALGATRPAPGLLGGATARPLLVTDAPGLYTVKLTVTSGGRVGTDLVDVRADPPPVAYISTSARVGDIYGVKVDGPGRTAAFSGGTQAEVAADRGTRPQRSHLGLQYELRLPRGGFRGWRHGASIVRRSGAGRAAKAAGLHDRQTGRMQARDRRLAADDQWRSSVAVARWAVPGARAESRCEALVVVVQPRCLSWHVFRDRRAGTAAGGGPACRCGPEPSRYGLDLGGAWCATTRASTASCRHLDR